MCAVLVKIISHQVDFLNWLMHFQPKEIKTIINTIGTIDDLIENNQRKVLLLLKIGDLLLLKKSTKMPTTDYAYISLGGTPSRKHPEYWNGDIWWINSGAITGVPAIYEKSELISKEGIKHSATKAANRGDSVLSIIEPSKNKVALILDDNVYYNQSVICIAAKKECYSGMLFFASRHLIDEIKGYATGAAQQSLNKEMFEKSEILVPESSVIDELLSIQRKIITYECTTRILRKIKNSLLKKYF